MPLRLIIAVAVWFVTDAAYAAPIEVTLEYKFVGEGLLILGNTNLPDGTKVGVNLEGAQYGAQDFDNLVRHGKFQAGPFTNRGKRLAGDLEAVVMIYRNRHWQQPAILEQLGSYSGLELEGEKYETRLAISVGTEEEKAAASEARNADKRQFDRLFATAVELLQSGQALEQFRSGASAAFCGARMEKLLPRAENLRSQIEQLPRSSDGFLLGVAGAHLTLCVTCSESLAMTNCNEAEGYLRRIKDF